MCAYECEMTMFGICILIREIKQLRVTILVVVLERVNYSEQAL